MRGFITDARKLPFDPAERTCDFCEDAATGGVEIINRDEVGTGRFVYGCARHQRLAADSVYGRRKTLRKKRRQDTSLFDADKYRDAA